MKTQKLALMLGVIALACLFAGCESKNLGIPNVTSDDGGVVVKGYNSKGYIQNTNEFPVRIRKIRIAGYYGEVTSWIKKFEPGEKVEQYIRGRGWLEEYPSDGFYVYEMNGALIGFVVPTKQ